MSKVQALPSTAAIKDPEVRAYLDALTNAWNLRNGNIGHTDDERFVTKGELSGMAIDAIAQALEGVVGAPSTVGGRPGGGVGIPPFVANPATLLLIDKLRQLIPLLSIPVTADIKATAENAEAGVLSVRNVQAQKDYALAQAVNTIWAVVNNGQSQAGGTSSIIQDGALAEATTLYAAATRWTQIQSEVVNPDGTSRIAAIRQEASTNTQARSALWTLRLNVGDPEHPKVAGFGIGITSQNERLYSAFTVLADQFYVASAENPGSAPFRVDTQSNTVHLKNTVLESDIASSNYNGQGWQNGGTITDYGTSGWLIRRSNGQAVFNSIYARGDIRATSVTAGSITADSIVAGSITSASLQSGAIGAVSHGAETAGISSPSGFRSVIAIGNGGYDADQGGSATVRRATLTISWDGGNNTSTDGYGGISCGANVGGATTITATISGPGNGKSVTLFGVKR